MKCWWIFNHSYSKWKDIENGKIENTVTKSVYGFYKIQERYCKKCGMKQLREINTYK